METQTVARDDGDANSAEDLRDRPSSCDADCSVKTTPPVERGESWLGPAPMAKATATAKAMLRKSQSPAPESPVPAPESPANTLQGSCSPSGSSAPLQGSIVGRPFALWPRTEADEVQQVKQCNRCIDLGLPDSAQMLALKHPWETAAMVETLTKEEVLGLLELATSREATSHARGAKLKAPSLAAFLNQSTGRSSESQTMGATIDVNLSESKIEVNQPESEPDSASSGRIRQTAARGGSLSGRETAVATAAQRSRATEDEPPKVSVLFGLDGWKMCFDS